MIIVVLGDGMKELETLERIRKLGFLFKEFYMCKCPDQKQLIAEEIKKTSETIRPKT